VSEPTLFSIAPASVPVLFVSDYECAYATEKNGAHVSCLARARKLVPARKLGEAAERVCGPQTRSAGEGAGTLQATNS
jgi:hypothetical protein